PYLGNAAGPSPGDGRSGAAPGGGHQLGPDHRPPDGGAGVRIAVWSPRPPSPSGIADYVAESLPQLARGAEVALLSEDRAVSGADLDVYHIGNSAAHAFAYRAALRRPGVVFLHDWSLHHLVLGETVEKGDVAG